MENTNENKPVRTRANKSLAIGLVMLILGTVIGVAATKYATRESAATHNGESGGATPIAATHGATSSGPGAMSQMDEWNPFNEMRKMQAEMDQVFQRSFKWFRQNPQLGAFKEEPGYSLSLDVRDLKDRFEVHASLPDAKASDVKVNLENNQTLKVVVSQNETEKGKTSAAPTVTEWGRYEQTIDLPAPVKADEMKVDRKDHELVITLPKSR